MLCMHIASVVSKWDENREEENHAVDGWFNFSYFQVSKRTLNRISRHTADVFITLLPDLGDPLHHINTFKTSRGRNLISEAKKIDDNGGFPYPIMRNSFCRSMCICILSWFKESAIVMLAAVGYFFCLRFNGFQSREKTRSAFGSLNSKMFY